MARVKEEPGRGPLAALQEMLSDGGHALLDQAQHLREGVQRRIVEVSRGVEEQVVGIVSTAEEQLTGQLDAVVTGLAVSVRKELEQFRARLRAIDARLADLPTEGIADLIAPIRTLATNAVENAGAAQLRVDELAARLQQLDRRATELGQTAAELTQATSKDSQDSQEQRLRLERVDERLTDLGREVGTKLADLGTVRERVTRLEARVLEASKDQIARAGETSGLRDRLARLEARLSDLSREQVARAVEAAGLRERLFRLEQRANGVAEPARVNDTTTSATVPSQQPSGG